MAFEKVLSLLLIIFIFHLTFFSPISCHKVHSHHINKPSPFGFLKNLQGCHKGDNTSGIHHLKNYLQRFGYLTIYNQNQSSHYLDDDNFDDQLEFALKTYQANYHLEATGFLDAKTVAEMSKPRCGVADIINGTTRMTQNNHHHHRDDNHGRRHFHTVSHYSFFPGYPRWPRSKSHLTYAFLPTVPSNAIAPVIKAFSQWDANTHFSFSRVSNHRNADLTISFERGNHGDSAPFDGPGGTIAHAFAPTNGRFHYDADERYGVGAIHGAYDLETVALHEIGHLLGLGHSSVRGAIMWPQISHGVTKNLHSNDIAGIRALYSTP